MNTIGKASIQPHFTTLTVSRQKGKIDHLLLDIIILAICAVISQGCSVLKKYCQIKALKDLKIHIRGLSKS
ncbi:hypothetical protein QUF90_19585 [Desulfococcaceae bacterium HSG9]|nr:hypothetical protein [Desulfococcaceae bacterium HSG9]